MDNNQNKIKRVIVIQPALPKYRIPVFKELASRKGIDLTVIHATEKSLENQSADGFKTITTKDRIFNTPLGVLFWNTDHLRYASSKFADSLIIVGNVRYLTLLPTIIKSRMCGVKLLVWTHGCSKQGGVFREKIRETVYRLSHGIIFYTETIKNQFIQSGWNAKNLFVAPNSIDIKPIHNAIKYWELHSSELETFQKANKLEKQQNIVFVSRFSPKNKLDLLLRAASQIIKNTHPNLKLILIGGGDTVTKQLQSLAEELNIKDHIIFTGPIYEEKQIAKWMLSSQIFCYPSNMGLSVQHAIAYNLPIVTSENTQLHGPEIEIIEHNQTGLVYSPLSAESLSEQLNKLLENDVLRKQISHNAYKKLITQYGISKMVDGLHKAVS